MSESKVSQNKKLTDSVIIRNFGLCDYQKMHLAMHEFTDKRDETTVDEMWLLQHHPVFTQGQAGKPEHILEPSHIPVIQSDRGGQVTYHGPGQLVIYLLLDLRRKKMNVRKLVTAIENGVINFLSQHDVAAQTLTGAPGVYVAREKICALGLRVRKGRTFHGLSFNVDMDLTPFQTINPCGYTDVKVTQLKNISSCSLKPLNCDTVSHHLISELMQQMAYTQIIDN